MLYKKILKFLKKNLGDIILVIVSLVGAILGYKYITTPKRTKTERLLRKNIKEKEDEIKIIDKNLDDYKKQYKDLDKKEDNVKKEYEEKEKELESKKEEINEKINDIDKELEESKHEGKDIEDVDEAVKFVKRILSESNRGDRDE